MNLPPEWIYDREQDSWRHPDGVEVFSDLNTAVQMRAWLVDRDGRQSARSLPPDHAAWLIGLYRDDPDLPWQWDLYAASCPTSPVPDRGKSMSSEARQLGPQGRGITIQEAA